MAVEGEQRWRDKTGKGIRGCKVLGRRERGWRAKPAVVIVDGSLWIVCDALGQLMERVLKAMASG